MAALICAKLGILDIMPGYASQYHSAQMQGDHIVIDGSNRGRDWNSLKGIFVVEVPFIDGIPADPSVPQGYERIEGREVVWFSRMPMVWSAARPGYFSETQPVQTLGFTLGGTPRVGPLPPEVLELIQQEKAMLVLAKSHKVFKVVPIYSNGHP